MKRSKQLQEQREAIIAFRDAFDRYLDLMQRQGVVGRLHNLVPKPGSEKEAASLRAQVSRLSGPAGAAAQTVVGVITYTPPPAIGGYVQQINPIVNWSMVLRPPNTMAPDDVLDYCQQAIGKLDTFITGADREERSMAGRVARFLSFPGEVRRLTGTQSRAGQAAAFGLGVFIQALIVTVVGGVIAAIIIALLNIG